MTRRKTRHRWQRRAKHPDSARAKPTGAKGAWWLHSWRQWKAPPRPIGINENVDPAELEQVGWPAQTEERKAAIDERAATTRRRNRARQGKDSR